MGLTTIWSIKQIDHSADPLQPGQHETTSMVHTLANRNGTLDVPKQHKLFHRILFLMTTTTLCVGIGFVYLLLTEQIFEAETRLHIRENVDTSKPELSSKKSRNFIATQAEIIRSPLIVARAIEKMPIELPPGFEGSEITFAIEKMQVAPILDTDVLSISYRSGSSEEVVAFVNALVSCYQNLLKTTETNSNSEVLEILSGRELSLRKELVALNQKHTKLREDNQLVGQSSDGINVHAAMLQELAQELTSIRLRKIELESRMGLLSSVSDEQPALAVITAFKPPISESSNTNRFVQPDVERVNQRQLGLANLFRDQTDLGAKGLSEIQSQLVEARLRLEQLGKKFGKHHIDIRVAQEQFAELKEVFDDRLTILSDSVERELNGIQQSEETLESLYADEQRKAQELDKLKCQEDVDYSEQNFIYVECKELMYEMPYF